MSKIIWIRFISAMGLMLILSLISEKVVVFVFVTAVVISGILLLFLLLYFLFKDSGQQSLPKLDEPKYILHAAKWLSILFMTVQFGLGMSIIHVMAAGFLADLLLVAWMAMSFLASIQIGRALILLNKVGLRGVWVFWTKPVIVPYRKFLKEPGFIIDSHEWLRNQGIQWRSSLVYAENLNESYFLYWIQDSNYRLQFKLIWAG